MMSFLKSDAVVVMSKAFDLLKVASEDDRAFPQDRARSATRCPRWPKMGERWAQDGPRDGSQIELKRGTGVKNRILTLLPQSRTHLDAIFSHLQRSEADLTPHVRSVLALLHPNEPRKALLGPSWGRHGA